VCKIDLFGKLKCNPNFFIILKKRKHGFCKEQYFVIQYFEIVAVGIEIGAVGIEIVAVGIEIVAVGIGSCKHNFGKNTVPV
jgi:hypothetical protein